MQQEFNTLCHQYNSQQQELQRCKELNLNLQQLNQSLQQQSSLLQNEILSLHQQINVLNQEVKLLQVYKDNLHKEKDSLDHNNGILQQKLELIENEEIVNKESFKKMDLQLFIPHIITTNWKKYKSSFKAYNFSKALAKSVWDIKFMGGACLPHLRYWANKDLRSNFFTPQACAEVSDFSGGRINGATFTLL